MKASKRFSFIIPLYATAHNRVYPYGNLSVEYVGTQHAPGVITADVDAIEPKGISYLQLLQWMAEKNMDAEQLQEMAHDAAQNHVENMWQTKPDLVIA